MSTMPTRFDGELFEAAKTTGAVFSRSAAQQLAHWARIGREFEDAPGISQRDIEAVLAGKSSYDALNDREQAVVRVAWDDRISEGITGLNLAEEFAAEGEDWVIADEHGDTFTQRADGTRTPVPEQQKA